MGCSSPGGLGAAPPTRRRVQVHKRRRVQQSGATPGPPESMNCKHLAQIGTEHASSELRQDLPLVVAKMTLSVGKSRLKLLKRRTLTSSGLQAPMYGFAVGARALLRGMTHLGAKCRSDTQVISGRPVLPRVKISVGPRFPYSPLCKERQETEFDGADACNPLETQPPTQP